MYLLNLKEQQDIVRVIEYLVEVHQKNNTVGEVMERFHLTTDEYRMCCNLAMPALRQGNMKGRFTAVSQQNKRMRKDLRVLYEMADSEDGPLADGVRRMYEVYCTNSQNVVYGKRDDDEVIGL